MAVNANSVIPTWTQSWDADFYAAITAQEDTCLSSTDAAYWVPLFQQIATAMDAWKDVSRQSVISNLVNPLYGYCVIGLQSSGDISASSGVSADALFSMGGFFDTAKGRSSTYYDDLDPLAFTSAKIDADVTLISASQALEAGTVSSLKDTFMGTVQAYTMNALFEDPPTTGVRVTKASMADLIFNQLGYKKAYQLLNVGSLQLPSSVS